MNLSLYKLRKKLNVDKSGQGSLLAVVLAGVVGTVLVSSLTSWYLSMNRNVDGLDDRLESMSIAMSEWQRLEHMSIEELINKQDSLKEPYVINDKYKVSVNMGEKGYFADGKCNSLTGDYAQEYPNCFSDTTMTVYDSNNNPLYTTRSLPLSITDATLPKPDWSRTQVVNKSTVGNAINYKFTVPANGMILYSLGGNVGGGRSTRRVYINGKGIYDVNGSNTTSSTLASWTARGDLDNIDASFLMVSQGDIVQFYIGNDTSITSWNSFSMKFVPYKGARFIDVDNDITSDNSGAGTSSPNSSASSIFPKGTILSFAGKLSDIPDGWHLCDGTAGTPNLKDRFLMGWGSNGVGSYVAAGLPNITATMKEGIDGELYLWHGASYLSDKFSGAWSYNVNEFWNDSVAQASWLQAPGQSTWIPLHFDASRSNSIYGNSNTVQPPSYVVYYIMKIK